MEKLDKISQELDVLEEAYSKLSWVKFTAGYDFGLAEAYEKLMNFMTDKENYEIICSSLDSSVTEEDKRKAEILHNEFKTLHLSKELNELQVKIEKKTNELSEILNKHRSIIDGKEVSSVEIASILSTEDDREKRKTAFFARAQVNKPLIDGGFIELLKLRKEFAKLAGAKDFTEYKLKEREISPEIFENWVSEVHEILPKMNEIRSYYAKKFLNDTEIMPWDETYIGSKIAPSLNTKIDITDYYTVIKDYYKKFGIDISEFNITYDVFSRANKSEWGYNFPISTRKDSRILANVKNKYYEYGVLLHETGHAVHSYILDPEDSILNRGVNGIISEGFANLFGGMIYDKSFYQNFFGDNKEVEEQFNNLKEYHKLTSLMAISNILFDQELYRNDIESLDDIYNLYWKIRKEVTKEEPFADEVPWGFRIHHTTHPIYLHNYFMGDVTCEMITKVFEKKMGIENAMEKPEEFGAFVLDNVLKVSGKYKYQELFKKISGEDFSLKYMV